jgi:hypothetical protein
MSETLGKNGISGSYQDHLSPWESKGIIIRLDSEFNAVFGRSFNLDWGVHGDGKIRFGV